MGIAELSILHKEVITTEVKMSAETLFTRKRCILTLMGLIIYIVDVVLDFYVGIKHLLRGNIIWGILRIGFVLFASLCTQIFSYTWFRDDKDHRSVRTEDDTGNKHTSCRLTGLHITQMGIFTRYFQLLRRSFQAFWCKPKQPLTDEDHLKLFGMAADLSMLRLFEAFLESVPQLLLQLYILLLGFEHSSVLQYLSMAFSFFNVAWSVVDYRRCLRRSFGQLTEKPLPTVVYLLYKLFTITTRIFSLSLLLLLNPLCSILSIALMWIVGTFWAFILHTNFCTSRVLEVLYRAIVGFILVFTFFNVKGQRTRVPMAVYYIFYFIQSLSTPFILYAFKPDVLKYDCASVAIAVGLVVGLGLLCVYYVFFHPREVQGIAPLQEADEVDAMETQEAGSSTARMTRFLQI